MASDRDSLAEYIEKLMEIQATRDEMSLSDEALREIALHAGLTEADLEKVEKAFNGHLQRGKGYLRYGNWSDAVDEFRQAVRLRPGNLDALIGMASALKCRWQAKHADPDRDEAEAFAKRCLAIEPGFEDALRLISEIQAQPTAGRTLRSRWLALIFAAISFTVAIAGAVLLLRQGPAQKETASAPSAYPLPAERPVAQPSVTGDGPETARNAPPAPPSDSRPGVLPDRTELPVTLVRDDRSEGIEMVVETSLIRNFGDSHSYNLHADFISEESEIRQLTVAIRMADRNGRELSSELKEVIGSAKSTTRPGDAIPMGYLKYEKRAVPAYASVSVAVHYVEKKIAPDAYSPPPVLPVEWFADRPGDVDIVVRKRMSSINRSAAIGRAFNRIELSVENTGKLALTLLQFRLEWRDADGEVFLTQSLYAASSSEPSFKPGQKRAVGGTYAVPLEKADGLEFVVGVDEVRF